MTLAEWIQANGGHGSGIVTRLMRESGVSFTTIGLAFRGNRIRDRDVARSISKATGSQVAVWELMQLTIDDCAPPAPFEPLARAS